LTLDLIALSSTCSQMSSQINESHIGFPRVKATNMYLIAENEDPISKEPKRKVKYSSIVCYSV